MWTPICEHCLHDKHPKVFFDRENAIVASCTECDMIVPCVHFDVDWQRKGISAE